MPPSTTPSRLVDSPTAYFITFSCYGSRLHGDSRGTVDRYTNVPGTSVLPPSGRRAGFEGQLLKDTPTTLDPLQRHLVLDAMIRHCEIRGWILRAGHVRSNHVHVVLWAPVPPEHAMAQLKSYASRSLNRAEGSPRRWWARHGSTKYLWDERQIAAAVDYVAHEQGAPMALHVNPKANI